MTNYLVTGGAGFIGSYFVRCLINDTADKKIIIYDKRTYAADMNRLDGLLELVHFIKGDICNKTKVFDAISENDIDVIINFAAESHVDRSIQDSSAFALTNYLGVQVLLDCANEYWIKSGKKGYFVQISTDEVYGENLTDKPHTEESALMPGNPYSASKAAADLLIHSYIRTHGLKGLIVRPSNNFGRGQNPEKFIPMIFQNIENDTQIGIYGDGTQKRTWIHASDTSRAILSLINSGKTGIYNISGTESISNLELVKLIISFYENRGRFVFIKDRPGHDRAYFMSSDKLETEIGFKPEISLEKGLYDIFYGRA